MSDVLLAAVLAAASTVTVAQPPAPDPVDAPPATLSLVVEPPEISIGDRVEAVLTLRARTPLATPPSFPVWEEHWGDAEILEAELPADQGEGAWSQRLTLTVFETGIATLTSVEVGVPTSRGLVQVASEPHAFQVRSVLPEDEAEVAPLAPEPVRALPAGRAFWWLAGGLALACCALGYLMLRRAGEIGRTLAALALSPFEALGQALERLRGEQDAERLVTGLSLELRRYLGRSIGFRAAEGTTTEVQRGLREHDLPPELVRETVELLREADRIKFAREAADRARAGRRLDEASELARRVEEWLAPPPVDEASTAESAS